MKEKLTKRLKDALNKDYDNGANNKSYDDYDKRRRLMNFNRFFAEHKAYAGIYIAAAFTGLFVVLHILNDMQNGGLRSILFGEEYEKNVSLAGTFFSYWQVMFFFFVLAAAGFFIFAYKVQVSFGSINVGQKGTARWATREEIEAEYKKIPEKESSFAGTGGIPVAREGESVYIDDSNTNTLVVGMTRSGKDQIITDNFMENISRAEVKCSMLIGDPKMEAARKGIPMLRERGYDTYLFNLIDPPFSMKYNPLTMIIDEYKMGDMSTAQELLLSLATSIFVPDENERDPFWKDNARKVFVAACWAEIEDNIALDKMENSRRMAAHKQAENERKKAYYKKLYGKGYELYRKAALVKKVLKGEPDLSEEETIEAFDEICRLRGINASLEVGEIKKLKKFAFRKASFREKKYFPVETNERKINIYSVVKMCIILSSEPFGQHRNMLDFYFLNRPEDDFARIQYGSIAGLPPPTKGTIMSTFEKEVQVFLLDNIAAMTSESDIRFENIFFGEKPVAIFYATSDYDKAFHFLATVFVGQMYFAAAKFATAMPGGNLPRRFHFFLNEICNLPKIDILSQMSTVCLGRNIILHLLIQSYGQLKSVYGDDAETLRDNCGNEIYLKTAGKETAKEISEKLGNETITVVNRTGRKLSIDKELTEMSEERPLMTADELMNLELGEMIVMRTMKRQDNEGKYIKGHPIKSFGAYRMKFSYTYLSDIMPQDQLLYRSDNLDRIIKANPVYKDLKLNLVEGGIRRITDVNLKKQSRSGKEYIGYINWRRSRFESGYDLSVDEQKRMNEVFDLLNLTNQQRQVYMIAGLADDEGNVIMEEYTLLNGQIEDHAKKLIRYKDKEISAKGYRLLDILRPLGKKEKSKEELGYEQEIEDAIVALGG